MSESGMVAFFLNDDDAIALLQAARVGRPGDVPPAFVAVNAPEDMHITLAYLGKTADLADRKEEIVRALFAFGKKWAEDKGDGEGGPITGEINGIARFMGNEADENQEPQNALVATFDSPGLVEFRAALLKRLPDDVVVANHGFIAHTTLGFLPATAPTPTIMLPDPPLKLKFSRLWLAWGDERFSIPFTPSAAKEQAEEDEEEETESPAEKRAEQAVQQWVERVNATADAEAEFADKKHKGPFSPNIGGGVYRDELPDSKFILRKERKFPVITAADVEDAWQAWPNYKGPTSAETFKRLLIRRAKKIKGGVDKLPKSWGVGEKAKGEGEGEGGSKAKMTRFRPDPAVRQEAKARANRSRPAALLVSFAGPPALAASETMTHHPDSASGNAGGSVAKAGSGGGGSGKKGGGAGSRGGKWWINKHGQIRYGTPPPGVQVHTGAPPSAGGAGAGGGNDQNQDQNQNEDPDDMAFRHQQEQKALKQQQAEEKKAAKEKQERDNRGDVISKVLDDDMAELFTVGDDPNDLTGVKPEYGDKLVSQGLAKKLTKEKDGVDGYELTPAGKAMIKAANKGDEDGARKIVTRAAAKESITEQKQAAAQAKKEAAAAKKAAKGAKGPKAKKGKGKGGSGYDAQITSQIHSKLHG